MTGSAVFSGPYRYELARWWGKGASLIWVMLNPSSAGAQSDDPTIRRCVGFTKHDRFGFQGMKVVNLFGLVATDPTELRLADDPVGHNNREYVERAVHYGLTAVAAWGAAVKSIPEAQPEIEFFMKTAYDKGMPVMCLGTTLQHHPKHPLYLPSRTFLRSYRPDPDMTHISESR